jgi:hypothetical protein
VFVVEHLTYMKKKLAVLDNVHGMWPVAAQRAAANRQQDAIRVG